MPGFFLIFVSIINNKNSMGFFKYTNGTKNIIMVMMVVVAASIAIAYVYYDKINENEDPRVIEARKILDRFNEDIASEDYFNLLLKLDTVEKTFEKIQHYANSYEMGVIYNNRASIYLSMALYDSTKIRRKDSLLSQAEKWCAKAVTVYEKGITRWEGKTKEEITAEITPDFKNAQYLFPEKSIEAIIEKRVEDIELSKLETPRRLSVTYTNLGIIKRNQYKQQEALDLYVKAIELWEDNHAAKKNLGQLIGRPVEDRSAIKKLFPKSRTAE